MLACSFLLNDKPLSEFKISIHSFFAFSGLGEHINKQLSQCIPEFGPIPAGEYYIVDRESGGRLGWLKDWATEKDEWFALYAKDKPVDDETFCNQVKRGQFRLHPSSGRGISKGCITLENSTHFSFVRSLLLAQKLSVVPGKDINYYGTVKVDGV